MKFRKLNFGFTKGKSYKGRREFEGFVWEIIGKAEMLSARYPSLTVKVMKQPRDKEYWRIGDKITCGIEYISQEIVD